MVVSSSLHQNLSYYIQAILLEKKMNEASAKASAWIECFEKNRYSPTNFLHFQVERPMKFTLHVAGQLIGIL
jgi:hypothetical protein